MTQDWDIRPLGKACACCGEAFGEGQGYHTRLADAAGGYARADFCLPCWQKQEPAGQGCGHWSGVFHIAPAEPERKVRKETAESMLRTLMESGDSTRGEIVYILAVMLERQRVLVERAVEERADGRRLVVYVHRKSGETFLIPDPGIGPDRLDAVQEEVMRLLVPDAPPRTPPAEGA